MDRELPTNREPNSEHDPANCPVPVTDIIDPSRRVCLMDTLLARVEKSRVEMLPEFLMNDFKDNELPSRVAMAIDVALPIDPDPNRETVDPNRDACLID